MSDPKYTTREAARLRDELLRDALLPNIRRAFAKHPALQSATLLVAQYWCDEALDAVHCELLFSERPTPDTAAAYVVRNRRLEADDFIPPRQASKRPAWYKWLPWLRESNPPEAVQEAAPTHELIRDEVNLPSGLDQDELDQEYLWNLPWDSNDESISLFAAFCIEDCHQEMEAGEAYSPYAIFRRRGDDVAVDVVGVMVRPWLDGVRPQEGDEAE